MTKPERAWPSKENLMRLTTIQQQDCLILYDADSLCDAAGSHQIQPALFTASYWQRRGRITGEAPGRGNSLFVKPDPDCYQEWVIRHYLRGGLIARLSRNQYLWMGRERTRAFAEMRLNAHLFERGLPVPRPIAAWVSRHGLTYEAALITQRIPGARALADCLNDQQISKDTLKALLIAVGRMIRRFHDHCLDHVDLNARNILIDSQHKPWLIDLDRCRLRRPGEWKKANLNRIESSIHKFDPSVSVTPLLQGYRTTD